MSSIQGWHFSTAQQHLTRPGHSRALTTAAWLYQRFGVHIVDRLLEKATRQHTKEHNSQLVLRTIYDSNQISRADLARQTRLTRTTISDVVAQLIERGLVEEIGHGRSSGGRTPILLRVIDNSRQLIGINLLDDALEGATINLRGTVQQRASRTLQRKNADSVLALIYDLIDELVERATRPLLGIGISTPGLMDSSAEVVRRAVNFGWQDLHLKALIQARYRLPVYMGNLAHMAALAEYTCGSGQKSKNLVVIHISQGIGAGIILDGDLFHGDAYGAGEIGHAVVVEDGRLCNCGNYGCLETVADSRAIVRRVQELARTSAAAQPGPALAAADSIDFEQAVRSFHAGDAMVGQVIDEVGRYLGIAAAQLVSILNIERIVISGPVARFGQPLRDVIERELLKRSLPTLAQSTEVVLVEEQPDTILLGISALLLNHELGLIRLAPRR
jgi:N-acetylglucosamine repressor